MEFIPGKVYRLTKEAHGWNYICFLENERIDDLFTYPLKQNDIFLLLEVFTQSPINRTGRFINTFQQNKTRRSTNNQRYTIYFSWIFRYKH